VQLRDGQTFAIAGLIDNRVTEAGSKIPGLGDLPIIGQFFRSRNRLKNRTELLAMVTPRIIRPLAAGEQLPAAPAIPAFPQQFMKPEPGQKAPAAPGR
jgi:pilus assembly protein CpaC